MSIFSTPGLPGATVPTSQVAAPAGDLLTRAQVERAVPPNLKNSITDAFVDSINSIVSDPLLAEQIRNNFISYTAVMKEGKFKIDDYLHAVTYVSYKLMGYSNQDAYFRTFPSRHAALVAKGTTNKDIAAYVSAYARGKLVNLIMEQSLVPTWVLNQDLFQKAINTQAEIMTDPEVSAKVRSDAANSLMTHLKKPEGKDFQINMDMRETSGISELNAALKKLAEGQISQLEAGGSIHDVTGASIIDVTPNEDAD